MLHTKGGRTDLHPLTQAMRQKGFTATALAEAVRKRGEPCDRTAFAHYVAGRNTPPLRKAFIIADILDRPVTAIFPQEQPSCPKPCVPTPPKRTKRT
jgi:transcriptional regulator with XRE-family HTH domain